MAVISALCCRVLFLVGFVGGLRRPQDQKHVALASAPKSGILAGLPRCRQAESTMPSCETRRGSLVLFGVAVVARGQGG